jgi:hypothetical protein
MRQKGSCKNFGRKTLLCTLNLNTNFEISTANVNIHWQLPTKFYILFCLYHLFVCNAHNFVSNSAVLIKKWCNYNFTKLNHIDLTYHALLTIFLYDSVRVIYAFLTHLITSQTVHYWLSYMWFTTPAEPKPPGPGHPSPNSSVFGRVHVRRVRTSGISYILYVCIYV